MTPAVLYARYSSFGQREESIEGQVAACEKYAEANGYCIVNQYIDRAASATNDHRARFQQMISDSESEQFRTVLVYQFDRFARNRYDSAIYKKKLAENGVKVISVTEPIADDPAGAFLEALLEAQAEFYSSDLSRKVKRGQRTNADRCLFNGGTITFGYTIDESKHYQLDEDKAPVVKRIFDLFIEGKSIVEIASELNDAGIRAIKGAQFSKNTVRRILGNKRYMGTYVHGDLEIPDGIPAIIDEEVFDIVQRRLGSYEHKRGVTGEYLLTGKLFCGRCGNGMVGVSGTSHTGVTHHYYSCNGTRKSVCKKKSARRDFIEDRILAECRKVLADENIVALAKTVSELCEKESDNPYKRQLLKELKRIDVAIENLLQALELGQEAGLLIDRISEKRREKETIESQIAKEEFSQNLLSETEIKFFLTRLRNDSIDEEKYRKQLVNLLVNKVFLYDDKMTMYFNAGSAQVEITTDFIGESSNPEGSYTDTPPPPVASHERSVLAERFFVSITCSL